MCITISDGMNISVGTFRDGEERHDQSSWLIIYTNQFSASEQSN